MTAVTTLVGLSIREPNWSAQVRFRTPHSKQGARGGSLTSTQLFDIDFCVKGSLPCHDGYQVANVWKCYGNTVATLTTAMLFALRLPVTYVQMRAGHLSLLSWISAGIPFNERRSGWMAIT